MISFSLSASDALETLSAIQLQAAVCVDLAGELVVTDPTQSVAVSQRADRLQRLASYLQTEMVRKREPYRRVKFAPGD